MKIAIRVNNEFDRQNVIPYFEKHFKGCNKHCYRKHQVDVGEIWAIDNDGWLDWLAKHQLEETPYTILDGVPENLELPKSVLVELQNKYQGIFNILSKEHNLTLLVTEMDEIIREVNKISSREQELEEQLIKTKNMYKECFELFIDESRWDEATEFLSTYGSGLAKDLAKKQK